MEITSETIEQLTGEVIDLVRALVLEDCKQGANHYRYVRVWPDGTVTSGREPSRCVPESEYFGRRPHSLTIWDDTRFCPDADPSWGLFAWVEDPAGPYIGRMLPDGLFSDEYRTVESLYDERRAKLESLGWRRFRLDTEDVVGELECDTPEFRDQIETALAEWAEGNLTLAID